MVVLKNGENEETTIFEFSDCKKDEVIIEGLQSGFFILSEDPYYYQDENGLMIGVDNSFTEFKIYNDANDIVDMLSITWVNQCNEEIKCANVLEEPKKIYKNEIKIIDLFPLIFLMFVFICCARMIREKENV